MKKCLIIGGGLAGLSTAVFLSKKNIKITLLEASPKLGGRAYSFNYPHQNEKIDNGQHILMGCYKYTFDYLKIIGSESKLYKQKRLSVKYVKKGGGVFQLKAITNIYPFNLIFALIRYPALSFKERIKLFLPIIDIYLNRNSNLKNMTIAQWLKSCRQNEKHIKTFWESLAVGIMNTNIDTGSAKLFTNVLKEIFFKGNKSSTIVIPGTDLSEIFSVPAEKYLISNGNEIRLSEKVEKIFFEDGRIKKIKTNKNYYEDYDYYISAIPPYMLLKILGQSEIKNLKLEQFEYSPIINIHLWLKNNPFHSRFYGLIDSDVHWIFNHINYITLVISSAGHLIDFNKKDILQKCYSELESYFPAFNRGLTVDYKIIKEKRATFIPTPKISDYRELLPSKFSNLILTGNWINTGLPATIEGAIKSGKLASTSVF